jgi:hypothetical protein
MYALAFAGLPFPVGIDDEGGVASKKTYSKNKGGRGGGEVAKLFMRDEPLLAGQITNLNNQI